MGKGVKIMRGFEQGEKKTTMAWVALAAQVSINLANQYAAALVTNFLPSASYNFCRKPQHSA